MTCHDVLKQIPALVMEELDVEVRRDVELHLASCGACRAERDAQQRTLAAMRGLPGVETSGARREEAVRAMTAARDELVERAILYRPSKWPLRLGIAAAAAVTVVAVGWMTLVPSSAWRVTAVRGTARVMRGEESGALKVGDRVRPGDVVSLLENAAATLESDEARVELGGGSHISVLAGRRIRLMQGTIRAESKVDVTIADQWGDTIMLRGAASVTSDLRAIGAQDPPRIEGARLRAHVERGAASLRGTGGELRLEAGEKARVDEKGKIKDER